MIFGGIIGFGNMALYHVKELSNVDGFKYKAVYDVDDNKKQKAREEGLLVYEHVEELLSDNEISVILVATSNETHKDYALKALKAGKNVICEKPATMTSSEYKELLDFAKDNGLILTTHQNRRSSVRYQTIKKLFNDNTLGSIFRVENRIQGSRGIADTWRRKKEKGGGMLYDWGAHMIDQILDLIPSKVVNVYCEMQKVGKYEVDDTFRLNLTFANEMTALIEVGTCNFIRHPLWMLFGKKGTAVVKDWDNSGEICLLTNTDIKYEDEIKPSIIGPSLTMALRGEDTIEYQPLPKIQNEENVIYENLVDVLNNNAKLYVTPEETYRVMQIIDLAFESAQKMQAIRCNV